MQPEMVDMLHLKYARRWLSAETLEPTRCSDPKEARLPHPCDADTTLRGWRTI